MSVSDLTKLLKKKLIARGFEITESDNEIMDDEIKRAISQINRCRHFDPTDEKLYDPKYEDMIIPLALTAFAKIGAEGQSSHSENGIVRNYTSGGDYPKDMLDEIIPLIK